MEKKTMSLIFATTLLMLSSCPMINAQKKGSSVASPTPSPAPAPAPDHVNITYLLSVAGPFHTFLNYLESTKVIDTFQNQANNTEEGITMFVPKDGAFSSLKKPSLANLTKDELKQLCLFHALPHYYSLSEFRNLSRGGPVNTFAGGDYTLNFTDVSGSIHMTSGWSVTKVSNSVFSTAPVAIYQVDKVLLPEAIFGTDIPPMPAPVPAPATAPAAADDVADSPVGATKDGDSPSTSPLNASASDRVMGSLILALVPGLLLVLFL